MIQTSKSHYLPGIHTNRSKALKTVHRADVIRNMDTNSQLLGEIEKLGDYKKVDSQAEWDSFLNLIR